MPKQVYTWGKVTAGDIISFRYNNNIIKYIYIYLLLYYLDIIVST